jgi:hypothetical protein
MLFGLLIGLLAGFLLSGILFFVCLAYRPRYVSAWSTPTKPKQKGIEDVPTLHLPIAPENVTEPMKPVYKTGALIQMWRRTHQTPEGWLL